MSNWVGGTVCVSWLGCVTVDGSGQLYLHTNLLKYTVNVVIVRLVRGVQQI